MKSKLAKWVAALGLGSASVSAFAAGACCAAGAACCIGLSCCF